MQQIKKIFRFFKPFVQSLWSILEKYSPLYYVGCLLWWPYRFFITIKGQEYIPKKGPVIVVANHKGDLDPWRISPLLPFFSLPVHWWGKHELFSSTALAQVYGKSLKNTTVFAGGWCAGFLKVIAFIMATIVVIVVRLSFTIPVSRVGNRRLNLRAFKQSIELLKAGKVIGIFPEGGVNYTGCTKTFLTLATKCNVTIIPVSIGARKIIFARPITPQSLHGKDLDAKAHEIMEAIYARLER